MAWKPGNLSGNEKNAWMRDREFFVDDLGRWCKVHCTYLRRTVPFPEKLVECPWFETVEEVEKREVRKRKS